MGTVSVVEWVRSRVIFCGRAYPLRLEALRKKNPNLVVARITRGVYLDVTDLRPDLPPWELRKIVTLSRMFAVKSQVGSSRVPVIFTGECAAVATGVATVWNVPNIAFRADVKRRHRRSLPPVEIAGVTVPKTSVYHVTGGVTVGSQGLVGGLVLAPPEVIVADECRREHPLKAFTIACTLLTQLTDYNWKNPRPARRAAAEIKAKWLRKAEEIRGRRAFRVFRSVVRGMDTGIQSPIEAMSLYAVKCHLPERKYDSVRTQHRVSTANGLYYLDIAFPDLRAGLESDGRVKYGDNAKTADTQSARHVVRHQALSNAGWALSHLTSEQLGLPNMIGAVGWALQEIGVLRSDRAPNPRGALYRAPPAEIFSRLRRF